jgi:hypothetical protein
VNVDQSDEQFELFLHEFQPRRPRVLPEIGASRLVWMRRLAAAAVMTAALGASSWFLSRTPVWRESQSVTKAPSAILPTRASTPKLSAIVLTRIAVEDPAHLDALLDASEQNRLPRFDKENSALHVLAKE